MAAKNEKRQFIKIRGANEHNLKNIDLDIPRNELVVLTGLSGSGKSSLAFDTIYAEGQRRYMESLSCLLYTSFFNPSKLPKKIQMMALQSKNRKLKYIKICSSHG